MGIQSVVIEKQATSTSHPQAHFINMRSMEIMKECSNDIVDKIEEMSPPIHHWNRFLYSSSLLGREFSKVDHFQPDIPSKLSHLQSISPQRVNHLAQFKLVPILAQQCLKNTNILLLYSNSFVTYSKENDGSYMSVIRNKNGEMEKIHSDYIIGADGATSIIRDHLNIKLEGKANIQSLINIHFQSKSLGKELLDKNKGAMLYFCFNPQVIAVVVAHDLREGEFVVQIPYFPPQQSLQDFQTKEISVNILKEVIGKKFEDIKIKNIGSWAMSSLVASQFSKGKVFLVGDAAHQFPPAGGFGMNSGIQDAHNLAWKIAAVEKAILKPDLLESYSVERKGVALENAKLSEENFDATLEAPRALGLYPWAAEAVTRFINSPPVSLLPVKMQKSMLENALKAGRTQLSLMDNPLNPFGQMKLSSLKKELLHGKSLSLLFEGQDLGTVYEGNGAAVDVLTQEQARIVERKSPILYKPCIVPGVRFPHVNFYQSNNDKGNFLSSINFLSIHDNDECLIPFTLFLPSHLSYHCKDYLSQLKLTNFGRNLKISLLSKLNESNYNMPDYHCFWLKEKEMESLRLNKQVILVRPDGHIMFACNVEKVPEYLEKMKNFINSIVV